MNIFDQLGVDVGFVILGMGLLILIQFILVIVALSKNKNMKKKYDKFICGADGTSLEKLIQERFMEIDNLKNQENLLSNRMDKLDKKLVFAYQKMSIVKYDAFKEMGGKLSFVLALLDENNNGCLINSVHSSREGCYTYVKEVSKGESFVLLANEEKQALVEAINYNKK